jgi:hypothetical protein
MYIRFDHSMTPRVLVSAALVGAVMTFGMRAPSARVVDDQTQPATSQAPAGRGQGGQGQGRGGGGRGGGPQGGAPIAWENTTGFRQIFNGTNLDGWDGDPTFWRVEGGAIVGETTAANPIKENSFIIWRGGRTADFDLKLEFRMNAGNSGVQYRSRQIVPGGPENVTGRWVLAGYQADIDFANQYTGMLYEERGRGFLAPRGQFNYMGSNQPPATARGAAPPSPAPGTAFGVRGQLGALNTSDALRDQIKQNDWNQFQVVARGNVVIHVLNGHVTALFVDDDVAGRALDGLLGLQIHTGPAMKVEFRNIWIKTL